ncbi:hypothetical protein M0812_22397 [Anaeramoeba flamelloides]|uniref:GOST seven transmembrane domain-containing protein n=1 Tax=Anaeramoeba flamelloides TaxID=1746091 RepID=A0AAV7YVA8_9EUKA|nr:hypothetical protein M0812_22397 [Anaeramoeba flamelloides]
MKSLIFFLFVLPIFARVEYIEILNDDREQLFLNSFVFIDGGTIDFNLQYLKLFGGSTNKQNQSAILPIGFLIKKINSFPSRSTTEHQIECSKLGGAELGENEYLIENSLKRWKEGFQQHIDIKKKGLYGIFFRACLEKEYVSFELKMALKNGNNYLSVGEIKLPSIYLFYSICYSGFVLIWFLFLKFKKKNAKSTRLHSLLSILLIAKLLAMSSRSFEYYSIKNTGVPKGWNIPSYIFSFCRGVLFFATILFFGSGYSSIKSYMSPREKKLLMLVLPVQAMTNIAMIVIEEASPATKDYFTLWDLLKCFDIVCFCLVLFPIAWTINELKAGVNLDNTKTRTIEKFRIFRLFYTITVIYIYITRIVVVIFTRFLTYHFLWVSIFIQELSSLIFIAFVAIQFRPYPNNTYVNVYQKDDSESDEMELQIMTFPKYKKDTDLIKRDIRKKHEGEITEDYENVDY